MLKIHIKLNNTDIISTLILDLHKGNLIEKQNMNNNKFIILKMYEI